MRLTHASVFSGIGGPEIAATMLGWDNAFHCEINEFGRKILEYWYPNSKSYEDITKTDFSEWRGRVDVLTGGFPCQPFSYAGQRRGAEDDRYLWPYMFKCIDTIRPTWVVAENVAGILTMVEQGEVSPMESQGTLFDEGDGVRRHRLVETFTLQRICDDLEGHGYEVQPVLVPACAVGAPHRRDRVFIVGRRAVADSDGGADRRTAREDEGKGREERLQERHEVRKPDDPNQVRPEGAALPQDSMHMGCKGIEELGHQQRQGDIRSASNDGKVRQVTAYVACVGEGTPSPSGGIEGSRCDENQQPSERGTTSEWNNRFYAILRNATNPDLQRRKQPVAATEPSEEERLHREKDFDRRYTRNFTDSESERRGRIRDTGEEERPRGCDDIPGIGRGLSYEVGERWANFPSVSPVHRGNDGLPFPLDDLAIPASKWRTESIKAYGNAIVPQVMYEIFRAIEIVERENL